LRVHHILKLVAGGSGSREGSRTDAFRSLLVDFLRDIPDELFESMRADGAGHRRMLLGLVLSLGSCGASSAAVG